MNTREEDLATNARVALFKDDRLPKNIQSITIIGKRWFDRTYGNTYCAARVYFDGIEVLRTPWTYGYGNYFEQRASEEMTKLGLIKAKKDESLHAYCERKKITVNTQVFDGLKRDMVAWGKGSE